MFIWDFFLTFVAQLNNKMIMEKINVDGVDMEIYYLNNSKIVELYESDKTNEEDKTKLLKNIISRFKWSNCPHSKEEDVHDVFARQISDFVNGKCYDMKKTAKKMAKDHRFLQQEMFKLFMEYITILSNNYEKNIFDGRNEWACKCSNKIVKHLKEKEMLF